jgi:hypothetical protein
MSACALNYYKSSATSPDPDVCQWRRKIAALAVGYALALYGATRLLLPNWHSAAVLGATFGISQVYSLGLAALRLLNVHLGLMYGLSQMFDGIVNGTNTLLRCQVALIRTVMQRIGNRAVRTALRLVWIPWFIVNVVISISVTVVLAVTWDLLMSAFEVLAIMSSMGHETHTAVWMRARKRARKRLNKLPLPFMHHPLEGFSQKTPKIRLLKLRRRWPFSRIRCELVTADLHSCPTYDAISYCWGKAPLTQDIYIHGRAFKVAPHVEELLYHLSSYRHDRLLWIDAICIDQRDNAEKDRQIPLMRDIYRRAASVIVWLDGVEMRYMARQVLKGILHECDSGPPEASLKAVRVYSDPGAEPGWTQLMNLYAHPWFSRAWVIQEITMAKKAVVLASGGQQLEWDYIARFATMAYSRPYQRILQLNDLLNTTVQAEAICGR